MATTIYRWHPSGSGHLVVDYSATSRRRAWDKKCKEMALFQSRHYSLPTGAHERLLWESALMILSVTALSLATGGAACYFGGPIKGVFVYLATLFSGSTGVLVYVASNSGS